MLKRSTNGSLTTAPTVKVSDDSSRNAGLPPDTWLNPRAVWTKLLASAAGTPWVTQKSRCAWLGLRMIAQGSLPGEKPVPIGAYNSLMAGARFAMLYAVRKRSQSVGPHSRPARHVSALPKFE